MSKHVRSLLFLSLSLPILSAYSDSITSYRMVNQYPDEINFGESFTFSVNDINGDGIGSPDEFFDFSGLYCDGCANLTVPYGPNITTLGTATTDVVFGGSCSASFNLETLDWSNQITDAVKEPVSEPRDFVIQRDFCWSDANGVGSPIRQFNNTFNVYTWRAELISNDDSDNISDEPYLGRVYHMTASTSPNLSEVHIINTSDSQLSFTGTLFHKSGDQLGDSDVPLHEGIVEPEGRLILSSTDLEQRFNELPWTGPAMLDVQASDQFELMSKLSRNGRVTNTNCVRTGSVHNLEGSDSSDVSYIRFINNGATALSDIRGTLYDSNGSPIGQSDVQLFESLRSREAVFLNRITISNMIGEEWTGVASLVLSENYSNLQLMNLNFVNDETFFNFTCYESASENGTASSFIGRAYHMTASTSPNLSEVHIINTSDSQLYFTGTLFHKSGNQLGESDVALHFGTVEPEGRLILSSTTLEQRFSELPWTGPAILDVQSTGQFELMSRLSRNGRLTNTNCVRRGNVHNLEGTDSTDVTYIRFINTGSTAISDIRGTIYDTDGGTVGVANAQLFEALGPREATFLNRIELAQIVGETWTGEASLVLADNYESLQLMNLNFVNSETFFNFSCYERADIQ